jgi:Acetyltransferase (GNAT) family.
LPSEKASVPTSIIVRLATVEDVELLHRFAVDLSTYEDEPDAVTSTPQTLARDGFGKDPKFAALIAERGGKPVGFALYTFNYSVWTAARGIFIEDIWVVPEERRGGVARATDAGAGPGMRRPGVQAHRPQRARLEPGARLLRAHRLQVDPQLAALPPERRGAGQKLASSP